MLNNGLDCRTSAEKTGQRLLCASAGWLFDNVQCAPAFSGARVYR